MASAARRQTLVVTSSVGWAQVAGEPVVEIRAGDIVWCPPGQRHWGGATPDRTTTYVAVQETGQGGSVRFGEKVTNEECRQGCTAASIAAVGGPLAR